MDRTPRTSGKYPTWCRLDCTKNEPNPLPTRRLVELRGKMSLTLVAWRDRSRPTSLVLEH